MTCRNDQLPGEARRARGVAPAPEGRELDPGPRPRVEHLHRSLLRAQDHAVLRVQGGDRPSGGEDLPTARSAGLTRFKENKLFLLPVHQRSASPLAPLLPLSSDPPAPRFTSISFRHASSSCSPIA